MRESEIQCACGGDILYADCCEPYHRGNISAPTALKLMRSRYAAFVYGKINYLVETTLPASRTADLEEHCRTTCESVSWVGLEIIGISKGADSDKIGKVKFKASYMDKGCIRILHEHSHFCRKGGKWYYIGNVLEGSG